MTMRTGTMLPLKVATGRASAELEGLHSRLERLEHGLDAVIMHSTEAFDTKSIGMLQELDMLRQSIGALADYLDQISAETDSRGMVNVSEALTAMPLRDMASRLGGQVKIAASGGHAELF
ncbi:chemotaxis protein [Mameliella sediminis]|uniref:chemotaxis protein n=1 Tax=Mameliella sediminis TaxID=2836866 RepID=UPI001C4928F0|nr:chemotaxis protein [Mameliella sediminis]MBY6116874.1 chemotaxis protein [Antarctobacter heliothermus]MBY6146627.1 chemotaxis protein [Mameliella alba]MBV7396540.1 chemotaxis protein [Mameliella sediminis]MBY6162856.1 chemotaxis protein [Mameliella alba]MBY6171120.1 chemotaxis protein [Mameliella alba]